MSVAKPGERYREWRGAIRDNIARRAAVPPDQAERFADAAMEAIVMRDGGEMVRVPTPQRHRQERRK